jgi:hypothetical protein
MSHPCEWVRARLARFLDGALPADEHAAVEAHRDACPECRAKLDALRETDRLVRDAAAAPLSGTEADAEARSFAALQAAMRRRYDLDAAAEARAREIAAEQTGAPARSMTPEEIASAPLDREIVREALPREAEAARARGFSLRDFLARLSTPTPAWRWMAIGVPAAAAAVVAVVLLVRQPSLPDVALDHALSSATHEAPAPAAPAAAAPAPTPTPTASPTTEAPTHAAQQPEATPAAAAMKKVENAVAPPSAAPEPEPAAPAVEQQAPAMPPTAEPLRMREEAAPSARVQTAAPSPTPSTESFAAAPAADAAAPVDEGPWTMLREFVESSKKADTADETSTTEAGAEPDRMALLLAAEDQLLTLSSTAAAADAEERSRSSERSERPSSGGGVLGRLGNLRDAHPERTGLRAGGKGASNGTSETRRAVERPPARLWLALADGWYLLYRDTTAGPDATSLAARALAAYEQAAFVPDSLADDDQARVRDRILELKTRSRRR